MENNFYYEVICWNCKQPFKVFEGTFSYQQYKENMNGIHTCEDCQHFIRLEAIKSFLGK